MATVSIQSKLACSPSLAVRNSCISTTECSPASYVLQLLQPLSTHATLSLRVLQPQVPTCAFSRLRVPLGAAFAPENFDFARARGSDGDGNGTAGAALPPGLQLCQPAGLSVGLESR